MCIISLVEDGRHIYSKMLLKGSLFLNDAFVWISWCRIREASTSSTAAELDVS